MRNQSAFKLKPSIDSTPPYFTAPLEVNKSHFKQLTNKPLREVTNKKPQCFHIRVSGKFMHQIKLFDLYINAHGSRGTSHQDSVPLKAASLLASEQCKSGYYHHLTLSFRKLFSQTPPF